MTTLPWAVLRVGDILWSEFLITEKTKSTKDQLVHGIIKPAVLNYTSPEGGGKSWLPCLGVARYPSWPPEKQATLWLSECSSSLLLPLNGTVSMRLWKLKASLSLSSVRVLSLVMWQQYGPNKDPEEGTLLTNQESESESEVTQSCPTLCDAMDM